MAPFVGDAVERYLEAYVETAPRLGAEWIVMHAGFHFSSDKERRMAAGLDRLKRIVGHAERHRALVLLENLNKEPDEAEVHYLAHTVEEWRYYFDAIRSSAFKLSFTVNHAHLVPEGIPGFVDAIDMSRVEEVRLADCFRNGHEVHLKPGAGDIDFADMFRRTEGKGFSGHYTNAFGSLLPSLTPLPAATMIADAFTSPHRRSRRNLRLRQRLPDRHALAYRIPPHSVCLRRR